MSGKSQKEMLASYSKQGENEEAIRDAMNSILTEGGYEESDIPQNYDLRIEVQSLINTNPRVFTALDDLDIDYFEIAGFKCFKADDYESSIESVYFISSTLPLNDSYL